MSKFKVGDRVKTSYGSTGEITNVRPRPTERGGGKWFTIADENGDTISDTFQDWELTLMCPIEQYAIVTNDTTFTPVVSKEIADTVISVLKGLPSSTNDTFKIIEFRGV